MDISVRLGFYANCNRLKEHDRGTQQCLAGTMERPHTNLLHSIPFSENKAFMYWLIVIERFFDCFEYNLEFEKSKTTQQ